MKNLKKFILLCVTYWLNKFLVLKTTTICIQGSSKVVCKFLEKSHALDAAKLTCADVVCMAATKNAYARWRRRCIWWMLVLLIFGYIFAWCACTRVQSAPRLIRGGGGKKAWSMIYYTRLSSSVTHSTSVNSIPSPPTLPARRNLSLQKLSFWLLLTETRETPAQ